LMTHRLRAAQSADRIVVLDDGRLVEEGTHAALLAGGGLYARLWRTQRLEEEIARA
jgi:ABC-type multidrug transport system fused ATPase/permease subunit